MLRGIFLAGCLLAAGPLAAQTWPMPDWSSQPAVASPAVQALDAYAFPVRDDTTRAGVRTDALLVIKDGVIVHERYAEPTRAQTPHLAWSISKSLFATVLGVAYGEGRFKLDDPV